MKPMNLISTQMTVSASKMPAIQPPKTSSAQPIGVSSSRKRTAKIGTKVVSTDQPLRLMSWKPGFASAGTRAGPGRYLSH